MKAYIAKDRIDLRAYEKPPELCECGTDYHKEWHGKCYYLAGDLQEQLEAEFADIQQDKDIIEVELTLNIQRNERKDSSESN